jgi:tetratricopeptide (TPR) repeat protein
MYLKGELYQQAISELRPAISQSRQRPDLLVVLARAYYLSGQRVPAADTCSSLLKKYPYCLEANRILADILADSERAEEAKVYFNRAIALDPYLAQVSSRASTADQVPEAAVVLEKLDWTQESAKAAVPSQPEWATSLGVEVDDLAAKDDSLPEWLSSTSDEEDIPADTSQDEVSEEAPIEAAVVGDDVAEQPLLPEDDTTPEEIPDWMKDAGWEPASGDVDKSAALPDFIDEEISSDELAPADMPDWIQDMAPEHTTSEDQPEQEEAAGEEEVLPADAEVLPWLAEEPPGPTDSEIQQSLRSDY